MRCPLFKGTDLQSSIWAPIAQSSHRLSGTLRRIGDVKRTFLQPLLQLTIMYTKSWPVDHLSLAVSRTASETVQQSQ